MKRNYVAVVLAGLLMLVLTAQAGAASMLPMFKNQESDTVTISREEYDRLLQYSKLDTLMQLVEAYYYEDADTDAMLEGAALGLMQGIGDVYSTYYTKEEMDKFNEETEGEYAGIGCQLLADPEDTTITVTRVFKNSPADEAGIRSGDKIVYVNDIGYVMVFDFLGDAYEGFAQAIAAFEEAGVSGMIIDLRNNGGGLVDACVQMADLILPEGVVVSMRDKAGQTTEYTIDGEYYDVPMVVLVNGYSASASEILAGAIRDTGAGTLVGEKTFGKGVVQSVINFPDGSGMKVTTARYYTPSGECIHEIGIEPDVEVSLDEDAVTRYGINNLPHDKDAQLQKAIELLSPQTEEAQVEDAA